MTPRSIRRAAERKAQKAARKEELSEARLQANRLNAQSSTGPITPQGKSISSLNAVKTGLTGRTVLLPSDDASAYEQHLAAYQNEYKPVGLRECELVQSLADTRWRLNRIPALEMAIYARGRLEVSCEDLNSEMIELEIYLKYEKQLKNLHLQEARLNHRFDKELAELRQLQKDRQPAAEEAEPVKKSGTLRASVRPPSISTNAGVSPDLFTLPLASYPIGFEFSTTANRAENTPLSVPNNLSQAA